MDLYDRMAALVMMFVCLAGTGYLVETAVDAVDPWEKVVLGLVSWLVFLMAVTFFGFAIHHRESQHHRLG